jgi:hypothetical protein
VLNSEKNRKKISFSMQSFLFFANLKVKCMGHKQFYRFVFALFVSLNLMVYLMKMDYKPFTYFSATFLAFGAAYLFAVIVFRRFGWRKHVD